ncbi:MAG TPA: glycerophosphodiester phosphodiesterase [Acidimicrobiia bacterium]|nr:glycerophosphodiester phosphodiesterase [Acidimicrobiia bacterium]
MAVITFAHRGARLVEPENTIPAFRIALEQGASGIETDVWLSSDAEVVCAHDPVVSRGLRRKRIAATTADELATYGVPRIDDVYRELGIGYECSVDVKTPEAATGLVKVAAAHGASEKLWVCSPDVGLLRTLRDESPAGDGGVKLVHSHRRSSIGVPLERHAYDLASAGIDAMNFHHTEWTAGLVSLFHRFEVKAFAWDTQEVRHLRAVLAMGIDAVYCDRPDRMVATVSEWVAD